MTFARMEAELRVANEELQDMSETDALTSLANRRKFDAAYESEWKRAVRGRLGMNFPPGRGEVHTEVLSVGYAYARNVRQG